MLDDYYAGEIRFFAGDFAPQGWLVCNGRSIAKSAQPALYQVIGNIFGGTAAGSTFNLPDLRGRIPVGADAPPGPSPYALGQEGGKLVAQLQTDNLPTTHKHSFRGDLLAGEDAVSYKPAATYIGTPKSTDIYSDEIGTDTMARDMILANTTPAGSAKPDLFSILQPYLPLTAVIATESVAENYFLGEVRLFAGPVPPDGWVFCDGRLLHINDNMALYSLLQNTYGGDGQTTFALPNLNRRVVISTGAANGRPSIALGQVGGTEQQLLTEATTPAHQHAAEPTATLQTGDVADSNSAKLNYFGWSNNSFDAYTNQSRYRTGVNSVAGDTDYCGMGKPVPVVQPYLGLNYIISLQGIYPTQP